MLYTGKDISFSLCNLCTVLCYAGQTKMPFEKQIKQFLLGVLRCVFICCRKCMIEARKATAEAGTAVGALAGDVYNHSSLYDNVIWPM